MTAVKFIRFPVLKMRFCNGYTMEKRVPGFLYFNSYRANLLRQISVIHTCNLRRFPKLKDIYLVILH